ncbi:cyclin-dependent kinase 14-like [Salvelinus namaycush]|uniref:Cyclin-dependent kinase 14-like n=1 Tax=Salvelinus namaycush TaxID=8040 RepID=A0A8U0QBQ7_SALNM|nr:cyclin-dependent kinase 14-like [Salvelinus namaycush]
MNVLIWTRVCLSDAFLLHLLSSLLLSPSFFQVLGTPCEDTWPGVHSLPHFKPDSFTVYSSKKLRQAWNKLGYVDHAEELATRFLQCFPKNRLSAQAALQHEYFSHLPPRLWEISDMATIFTVPNIKLQVESGDSIQVCTRTSSSHAKGPSSSKH